ncbi:oligopeptide transport system substrate-binding protein [Bacillus sp. 491mf]|uniref:peptide ABC transporter substrate-binding protein n=1 Tax=Bacillus TaxID=1386 RepID=UPI000558F8CB|nr:MULTISPECIES: peptide ABC transporter substrate-binding protein [unclassified Bacillus (in: firmicutes)]SFC89133.1 oligopeptide transport system substrate-binding protein [Bacillus sp. 491mf]
MKRMKKITAVVAPVLAMSVALTACSGAGDKKASTEPKNGDKKTEGKLAEKQVLNLAETAEIPSMDVSKSTDTTSSLILGNTMEGLYRLDKENKPIPGIAESHKKSDDGKKYTFKLRKDAKWSNGDPVTAKDFVFAWKRLLDPKTAAEYAFIMYDLKNAKAINESKSPVDSLGIKAVDDYTLEVELDNPVPYFLNLTAFTSFLPLNEKVVKEHGDKYGLEADKMVYNGPFKMSEWKHEQGWKLVKNDQYWDKATVKLEEINFSVVKEQSTRVNLYESGQLDRVSLTAEYVDKYKANKDEFGTTLDPSTYFLRLNQKRNGQDTVLKNKKVRQAIAMAFDKKALTNVILNNGSKPVDFLIPEKLANGPDGKDFRETFKSAGIKTDLKKAKQVWEEAKKELGKEEVTIEFLNYDSDNAKKVGEYLKEQLEKNLPGLKVNMKLQPFKQKLKLETAQDYDLTYAGWNPDYADPMTFLDMFKTGNPQNEMSYSNAKYDEIVTKSQGEWLTDQKKRWEEMSKAEKILLEDEAALVPMYQSGGSFLQRPTVQKVYKHNVGSPLSFKWTYITEKESK